jgi:hypothetical protein
LPIVFSPNVIPQQLSAVPWKSSQTSWPARLVTTETGPPLTLIDPVTTDDRVRVILTSGA